MKTCFWDPHDTEVNDNAVIAEITIDSVGNVLQKPDNTWIDEDVPLQVHELQPRSPETRFLMLRLVSRRTVVLFSCHSAILLRHIPCCTEKPIRSKCFRHTDIQTDIQTYWTDIYIFRYENAPLHSLSCP